MNRKITTLAFALTAAVGALAFSVDSADARGGTAAVSAGAVAAAGWCATAAASGTADSVMGGTSDTAITAASAGATAGTMQARASTITGADLSAPTEPSSDVLLWSTSRAAPAALFFACFRAYGGPASSGASRPQQIRRGRSSSPAAEPLGLSRRLHDSPVSSYNRGSSPCSWTPSLAKRQLWPRTIWWICGWS
jgi:hypothetical protein